MMKTHVDILGKILRCNLKNQKELRDVGFAWWKDYSELEENSDRFDEFVVRRKENMRLRKDHEEGEQERIDAEEAKRNEEREARVFGFL